MPESYRLNLEYRDRINAEILYAARRFCSGEITLLACVRELSPYFFIVEHESPGLAAALKTFLCINSETDALVVGDLRKVWHPSSVHGEDERVYVAEERYRNDVRGACFEILRLLSQQTNRGMGP